MRLYEATHFMEVVRGQFSLMECHALAVKTDCWSALMVVCRSIAVTITTMLEWSVCQVIWICVTKSLVFVTSLSEPHTSELLFLEVICGESSLPAMIYMYVCESTF